MIRKYAEIFCWKNVSSFCSAKATHIFSAKTIRILYIESAKTVNEMTLNELVKLTTLWTTGPRIITLSSSFTLVLCNNSEYQNNVLFTLSNGDLSQQEYDAYTTSHQRRCSVMTLHRRWCDVDSKLRAGWVFPLFISLEVDIYTRIYDRPLNDFLMTIL